VAPEEQPGVQALPGYPMGSGSQLRQRDRLLLNEQLPVRLHADIDRFGRRRTGRRGVTWQTHRHVHRGQGRSNHEDDQQHQHDVDEGGDVHLRILLIAVALHRWAGIELDSHAQRPSSSWRETLASSSAQKLSRVPTKPLISRANLLKIITAGMAANRPSAVASSASAMPGATTARLAVFRVAMLAKLLRMPHTVPNSPIKGAVA